MAEEKHSGSEAANGPDPATQDRESVAAAERGNARRRFLTGGLVGAPMLVTLSSRPAWATYCSPSAMHSGNLSRVNTVECRGLTPGYWKTHEDDTAKYVVVGPCNPITSDPENCDDYTVPTKEELEQFLDELNEKPKKNKEKIEEVEAYLLMLETYPNLESPPFGTPFSEVFGPGLTTIPETTMMQALWLDDEPPGPPIGSGGPAPVLAHSAAAWLNAHEFGKDAYGLSPDEVVLMVQNRILTDPLGLKADLEMLNERG